MDGSDSLGLRHKRAAVQLESVHIHRGQWNGEPRWVTPMFV